MFQPSARRGAKFSSDGGQGAWINPRNCRQRVWGCETARRRWRESLRSRRRHKYPLQDRQGKPPILLLPAQVTAHKKAVPRRRAALEVGKTDESDGGLGVMAPGSAVGRAAHPQ